MAKLKTRKTTTKKEEKVLVEDTAVVLDDTSQEFIAIETKEIQIEDRPIDLSKYVRLHIEKHKGLKRTMLSYGNK